MQHQNLLLGCFAAIEIVWSSGYFISLSSRYKEIHFDDLIYNEYYRPSLPESLAPFIAENTDYINRQLALTLAGYGIVGLTLTGALCLILILLLNHPRFIKHVTGCQIIIGLFNIGIGGAYIGYASDWDSLFSPVIMSRTPADSPLNNLDYKTDVLIQGAFFIILGVASIAFYGYNVYVMNSGNGGQNRIQSMSTQQHLKRTSMNQYQQQAFSGPEQGIVRTQQVYASQHQITQQGYPNSGQNFQQQPYMTSQADGPQQQQQTRYMNQNEGPQQQLQARYVNPNE